MNCSVNKIALSKLIEKANTGADAIKRAPIVKEDTGVKCLRIGDISNNRPMKEWGFTKVTDDVIKKFLLKKDDVIIARTGNTIGVVKYIENDVNSVYNNGLIRLRVNKKYNAKYVYYNLISEDFKGVIYGISAGTSTQPNMKIDHLLQYEVADYNIEEQNMVVNILSSLDKKIELNNGMNKTLEEMAQALFKRWFVDFEFPNEDGKPYKSNGGEMVESELGMIPKGWKVSKIQEIGDVIAGGTPSTKREDYYDGNIPWITPKDLSGYDRKFISKGQRSITELGLQKSSAKLMKKGTVLFSSRAPIGYIVIAKNDVTTNQGFKSIACNEEIINNNYVYYYLKFNKKKIESIASGSTFKEVSGATMKMIDILVPSMELLNKFKEITESYDNILSVNYIENDLLIQLRDLLLPKLMSGEIRVEDIEEASL